MNDVKQVIFHGGCHGCTQQAIHSVDFCYDCRYFDAEWNKPDLNNKPPDPVDLIREEVKSRRQHPLLRRNR